MREGEDFPGRAMAQCYRFTVTGRVQGVFFRQSTVDEATRLGLDGWVRNLADGRVEGVAAGDEAALRELQRWLQHGPRFAVVATLEWQPGGESPPAGFVVRQR
jgi:acylphosphatase